MIVDTLNNASRYYSLHPLFRQAFEYIAQTSLETLEPGKFEVAASGIKAIVSLKEGMTAEASLAKFECHNRNIDIQYCISGREEIGWKPRGECTSPNGPFQEEKDVQFYSDAPDMFFGLAPGQFAIFFPEDVHAPMIGRGEIKKLVLKIKI